ncbi:MAG TPA: hypothetical protein VFW90_02270 [Candidatus Saccharimonadales bacterium]|nr:hypothetical protein [Candidatus Saccharimonadales bacterium]
MNYGTHLEVGYEVAPKLVADHMPQFGLGVMLPDLIAMSGSRVDRGVTAGRQTPLVRGVKFHQRTDTIFHSQDPFRELRSTVQDDLESLAQNPHQARGWSEVGIELLIDGMMFQSRDLRRRYKESMALSKKEYAAISIGNIAVSGRRFVDWLSAYADHGIPVYETPADVVRALYRRLATRDLGRRAGSGVRLGFDRDQGGRIIEIFEAHLDDIHETGQALVKNTIAELRNPKTTVTVLDPVDPDSIRRAGDHGHLRAHRRY